MEILKNLSEEELDALRDVFESHPENGLNGKEFRRAMLRASRGKVFSFPVSKIFLENLFASVDFAGSGRVTWDQLTMFAIDQARSLVGEARVEESMQISNSVTPQASFRQGSRCSSSTDSSSGDEEDGHFVEPLPESNVDEFLSFRPYHAAYVVPQLYGAHTTDMRVLDRVKKVVKVTTDLKGAGAVSVFDMADQKLSVYGELPRTTEAVLAWDYIPATGGISCSNSIACTYNGGLTSLYTLEKNRSFDELLPFAKSIRLSETQTAMRWTSTYNRLILGSRGGIVSVWDIDDRKLSSQEKIHGTQITGMCIRSGMMYTSCLDHLDSVKAVDLERSIVRYSFNDHHIGGALGIELDDEFLFSYGFEAKITQRLLQSPRSHPAYLYDAVQPHQGRISSMRRLPNSPILLTGDTKGFLKMWDLRMGSCMQTMNMESAANIAARGVDASTAVFASRKVHLQQHEQSGGKSSKAADLRSGANHLHESPSVSVMCPLPGLGIIMVGTTRDLVVLTAADTTCPEKVDDNRPCRFLLLPNPQQILTVHEKGVKLWNTITGHLVFATENDLVRGDITACTLVDPLRRQFVVGTSEGVVRSFSVALGKPVINWTPTLREAGLGGQEVVAVHVLPQYREYPSPYMVIAYGSAVVLMPMVAGCAASAVIRLHALHAMLDGGSFTIRDALMQNGFLYVSVSNNVMYIVDIMRAGGVIASYKMPTLEVENLYLGQIPVTLSGDIHPRLESAVGFTRMSDGECAVDISGGHYFTLCLCGDSSGRVVVSEARTVEVPHDPLTARTVSSTKSSVGGTSRQLHSLLGDWDVSRGASSWKWYASSINRRYVRAATQIAARGSKSHSLHLTDANGLSRLAVMAAPGSVGTSDGLPIHPSNASPVISHMAFIEAYCVLVTADVKGKVKLWDMLGVALGSGTDLAANPLDKAAVRGIINVPNANCYPPRLITEWSAHECGITDLVTTFCPTTQLPVVITSSIDREVRMWSADGTALGMLAAGRLTDDNSGGNRYGLEPYLFAKSADNDVIVASWGQFLAYLQRRAKRRGAPPLQRRLDDSKGESGCRSPPDSTLRPTTMAGGASGSAPLDLGQSVPLVSTTELEMEEPFFVTEAEVRGPNGAEPEEEDASLQTSHTMPNKLPKLFNSTVSPFASSPKQRRAGPALSESPRSLMSVSTTTGSRRAQYLNRNGILQPSFASMIPPRPYVPCSLARTGATQRRLPALSVDQLLPYSTAASAARLSRQSSRYTTGLAAGSIATPTAVTTTAEAAKSLTRSRVVRHNRRRGSGRLSRPRVENMNRSDAEELTNATTATAQRFQPIIPARCVEEGGQSITE